MSAPRRDRLARFHSRRLDELRGQTHRAIALLNVGTTAKLLHRVTLLVDARGSMWKGARELAIDMELSETWVRMLLERACGEGLLQQIRRGGGRHRTSVYLLKVGAWRDDPHDAHMHRTFADRVKATLYAYEDWLAGLFLAHGSDRSCWRYAPARVKAAAP